MSLLNKRLLAVSVAALTILCSACNKPVDNKNNGEVDLNGGVSVNNPKLPEVNDEMAPSDEDKIEIKLGLVKNSASTLGAAYLFVNSEDNSAYEKYTPVVYNSVDELYNAFSTGEIEAAVLPPDKAALAYGKIDCYVTAITGGSNYYIAENGSEVNDIADLSGKTISVSAEDTLAKTVLNVIAAHYNISVNYNDVESNDKLVSGLKDSSVKLALVQEPYLSKVTGDTVRSAVDLYDFWNEAVGQELVTSCLVVNKVFVSENAVPFQFFMKDYSASAAMARRNMEETSQNTGKFALIDDVEASKAAIPGCGVKFESGSDMAANLTAFYSAIFENNPEIIGGRMPEEDFYFVKE